MASAFSHPSSFSYLTSSFSFPHSNFHLNPYPERNIPSNRSYAQVIKEAIRLDPSNLSSERLSLKHKSKDWVKSRWGRSFFYGCGDFSHLAKDCRDPVKCFSCGFLGTKNSNVPRNSPCPLLRARTSLY